MSQQGFPGNFIMPDDNADFSYSNLIVSRSAIEAAAEEFRGDSFNNQFSDPKVADNLRTQLSGLATAALMLAQYYIQQITYQLPNGPGTPGNPIEVPYDDEVKCKFIQSLGSNPSASGLFNNYDNQLKNFKGVPKPSVFDKHLKIDFFLEVLEKDVNRFDVTAFKKDNPKLYTKYLKASKSIELKGKILS